MSVRAAAAVVLLAFAGTALAQQESHAGHEMDHGDDPHAGHDMAPAADEHAGHHMPAAEDPHAGHTMAPAGVQDASPPPGALAGPEHAADAVWDKVAMTDSRAQLLHENGAVHTTAFLVDRLEGSFGNGQDLLDWQIGGWSGGDIHRFWWKSEGQSNLDQETHGEVQALYSRAISPFWNLQTGLRQDFRSGGKDPTHLVFGFQGLAPYWWEMDAAAFLSKDGDLTARVEGEYDLRITQRLTLQPRLEIEAAASDIPALGLGSGLTHYDAGLRLRYEIRREFAPYLGLEWNQELGGTADRTRASGHDSQGLRLLVGVRAWW
ncbi:MAG: copper resistance protein B [Steroidobacteraceae bacterium]